MNINQRNKRKCQTVERLTANFITRSKKRFGNKFDYSKTVFRGRDRGLITVICPKHGEVSMTERAHYNTEGCPECGEEVRRSKLSMGTEEFVKRATVVHNGFYDYSRVKYVNAHTKVEIICPHHGSFLQGASKHLLGRGCHVCAKNKIAQHVAKRKFLFDPVTGAFLRNPNDTETFEQKARREHGDKYDYSCTVLGKSVDDKVAIRCPTHGIFYQVPRQHLKGNGCPDCYKERRGSAKRGNIETFLTNARRVHGDTFDYSRVTYITDKIPVLIGCRVHGFFKQKPNSHLNGAGCKVCSMERARIERTRTTEEYIELAKQVQGEHTYDYSETVYKGVEHKIKIICRKHGPFKQAPSSHLKGRGCPRCNESRGEKRIDAILTRAGFKFIREFRIPNISALYRYDFYLYEHNILLEYHGAQHFKPAPNFGGEEAFKIQQKRDRDKRMIARDMKMPLIEINYKHFKMDKDRFEAFVLDTVRNTISRRTSNR